MQQLDALWANKFDLIWLAKLDSMNSIIHSLEIQSLEIINKTLATTFYCRRVDTRYDNRNNYVTLKVAVVVDQLKNKF